MFVIRQDYPNREATVLFEEGKRRVILVTNRRKDLGMRPADYFMFDVFEALRDRGVCTVVVSKKAVTVEVNQGKSEAFSRGLVEEIKGLSTTRRAEAEQALRQIAAM